MDASGLRRSRGALPGFANSGDVGGLPLPGDAAVPARRIVRANTPERLDADDLATAEAFGFETVLDLRSREEVLARPHPLAHLPGYRALPLIDPAAEAREDVSRYRTLGGIYRSSLQRNAAHIAAIFRALATAPRGPVLISCHAGLDRTGMVVALLLDLAGVDRETIEADYAAPPNRPHAPTNPAGPERRDGSPIREMLAHVSTAYGTTAGYLRWLGLDDATIGALRERLDR
ncbi:Tyrosine phosphatase family protein [Blastococcus aurantiacus]|uniref:Tyrosine phosphatase family protein n=1 Tax=Blastococcus aurantiacus TaxID=1550231 RepID=A0A1G7NUL7_9ACTN|nr:tyrosine-protein phosphatase [Blastococcus aurantiacus]SDF77745.1 Tyrosine phosphatase family protein [Blastococcus aurantiacus]